MTRILLDSLTPATNYAIQLRSKGADGSSDWSRIFPIVTNQDAIAPQTPGSVAGTMSGTAFILTWAAVTLSSDSSPAYDLDTYEVKVTSSGSGNIGNYKTKSLRFEFNFEMNRALFGTPQANVQMQVRAVDVVGNASAYSAIQNQTNAAPAPVTSLVLSSGIDGITAGWVGIADTDFDHYEMHVGTASGFATSGATLVWTGKSTSANYVTVSYATTYYVKVIAYDVFGTASTAVQAGPVSPRSALALDITAPAVPTGLTTSLATTVDQITTATVSWTAVANPTNDLQGYIVRYKASADTDYDYVNVSSDVVSTKILVSKPYVNYDFAVRSYDFYANYSAWSATSTATGATNSAPGTPAGMVLFPGIQSVIVQWTENTELDVTNGAGGYEVQIDTVNTFSSGNLKTVRNSGTIISFTGLTSNTLYYVRMRAVDSLGATSAYNTTASTTTGVVTNSDVVVGTLSGDRITAATLSGDRVIANTLDANTLKANTIVTQNLGVNSTLTMGDASNNGIIKSFGFSTGVTGWQISKTGFEVNQGTIAAAALLIQDGQNAMLPQYADFESATSFYTTGLTYNAITTHTIASATPRFNSQYLSNSWTLAGSNPAVYLGVSTTDYNTIVEPAVNYILSAWIRNPGAVTTVVRGNVKLNNAATVQAFSVTPTISSSTWVRYSGIVAIPAGITTVLPFFDSTTLTASAGFDLDGIQLERQMSGATTPSPWAPPGVTRIDGGIIRTGKIISSATVTVNSVAQPSWSINTTGAAQFGDVTVRGKILVGGAGADPDAGQSYISSGNFVTGTTGWKIDSAGSAELSSGVFRGNIFASNYVGGSIVIPDASTIGVTTPGYNNMDITGYQFFMDGSTNLVLDPSFEMAATATSAIPSATATATRVEGPIFNYIAGQTAKEARFGQYSLQVTDSASGAGYVDIPLGTGTALGLVAGAVYTVSVYVSSGTANGSVVGDSQYTNMDNFQIYEKTVGAVVNIQSQRTDKIDVLDYGSPLGTTVGPYIANGTSYQLYSNSGWRHRWMKTFTMGAGIVGTSTFYVRLPGPSNTNVGGFIGGKATWYDGLQLERKPYATRYVDGSQNGFYGNTWNSTKNGSQTVRNDLMPALRINATGDIYSTGLIRSTGMQTFKIKVGTQPPHGSHYQVVYKTAAISAIASGVQTLVVWDGNVDFGTEDEFPMTGYANHMNTGTGYFVAPFTGTYLYVTTMTWAANNTGGRQMRHQIGPTGPGTEVAGNFINQMNITPGTGSTTTTLTSFVTLKIGQSINCLVAQTSGAALATAGNAGTTPAWASFAYVGGI